MLVYRALPRGLKLLLHHTQDLHHFWGLCFGAKQHFDCRVQHWWWDRRDGQFYIHLRAPFLQPHNVFFDSLPTLPYVILLPLGLPCLVPRWLILLWRRFSALSGWILLPASLLLSDSLCRRLLQPRGRCIMRV